ncbi:MAG: hypothetical protein LBE49_06270 [Deltaproteobacteria bacterium]|jgi:hypothetical protein|nr:hypothetical protein [Deltaproteobacteria bacterium]
MNEQSIDQLRRGDPGHDEHVIVGQIRSVSPGWEVPGHYIARFVVDCPFRARKSGKRHLTSYECCVYDSQAKLFEKLDFKKGDTILVRLEGLRLEAYLDAQGKPRASLRAFVGKFVDLRPRLGQGPGGPAESRSEGPWGDAPPRQDSGPGLSAGAIVSFPGQAGPWARAGREVPGKAPSLSAAKSLEAKSLEPKSLEAKSLEPKSLQKPGHPSDPPLPLWADPPLAEDLNLVLPGGPGAGLGRGGLEELFYEGLGVSDFVPRKADSGQSLAFESQGPPGPALLPVAFRKAGKASRRLSSNPAPSGPSPKPSGPKL